MLSRHKTSMWPSWWFGALIELWLWNETYTRRELNKLRVILQEIKPAICASESRKENRKKGYLKADKRKEKARRMSWYSKWSWVVSGLMIKMTLEVDRSSLAWQRDGCLVPKEWSNNCPSLVVGSEHCQKLVRRVLDHINSSRELTR